MCKNITKPKCVEKWKTLYDKRCRTTYKFSCGVPLYESTGYGYYPFHVMSPVQRVFQNVTNLAEVSVNKYLTGKPVNIKTIDKNIKCIRTSIHNCYKIPRYVHFQKCKENIIRKCKKVRIQTPQTLPKRHCHNDIYDECQIENEPTTKILEFPTYSTECNNVPGEICNTHGNKDLGVKCVYQPREICKWIPVIVNCTKLPRHHCYKLPYQVEHLDCKR